MDTTPKYIKQCERAEEIQNCWKAEEGDFVAIWGYSWLNNPRIECCSYDKFEACGKGLHVDEFSLRKQRKEFGDREIGSYKVVWLPRQDQLQEMVKKPPFELLDDFHETINEYGEYPYIGGMGYAIDGWSPADKFKQFTSLEQLWLAFVMHEKYGKHWDNEKEEWVK